MNEIIDANRGKQIEYIVNKIKKSNQTLSEKLDINLNGSAGYNVEHNKDLKIIEVMEKLIEDISDYKASTYTLEEIHAIPNDIREEILTLGRASADELNRIVGNHSNNIWIEGSPIPEGIVRKFYDYKECISIAHALLEGEKLSGLEDEIAKKTVEVVAEKAKRMAEANPGKGYGILNEIARKSYSKRVVCIDDLLKKMEKEVNQTEDKEKTNKENEIYTIFIREISQKGLYREILKPAFYLSINKDSGLIYDRIKERFLNDAFPRRLSWSSWFKSFFNSEESQKRKDARAAIESMSSEKAEKLVEWVRSKDPSKYYAPDNDRLIQKILECNSVNKKDNTNGKKEAIQMINKMMKNEISDEIFEKLLKTEHKAIYPWIVELSMRPLRGYHRIFKTKTYQQQLCAREIIHICDMKRKYDEEEANIKNKSIDIDMHKSENQQFKVYSDILSNQNPNQGEGERISIINNNFGKPVLWQNKINFFNHSSEVENKEENNKEEDGKEYEVKSPTLT